MSSGQQIDVEIIKRGYLKYKIATSPGTTGTLGSSQQSKSFRDFWFVFRVRKDIPKVFEYYGSEKEFSKRNSHPKGVLQLKDIQAVHKTGQDRSKQFILTATSGSLHVFEASSVYDANQWISALNAVLFGRGIDGGNVVTFFVDVWDSHKLSYAGPGIMEITEDAIIIWTQDRQEVVIEWKLKHIRMFKAKQDHFQVMAGTRSSTGEGTFQFGTLESVLITNTLGTVIDLLAYRHRRPQSATSLTLTPQITTPNRSKSEKRGVPPVPPPYTSMPASTATYSTLNRDRTDTTQALIPSFSDVPGSRGQSSSNTNYSQLKSSDSAATGKGGGGGGKPKAAPPPIPYSSPPVKLPLPTGEGEYSSIDGGPGGNDQSQSRNFKKFHSQPTSGGDYSALVSPVNSAHSKRALPPHPISKAGSLDADENIGGIYSDIDAYSQIEYSEVDAPKQKPAPPSPAPPVSSHSNAPPPPPPPRGYSSNDYSEVQGAALVPSASGMDGYGALHGTDLGEIRRTKLPVDVNPDQHNYSRLKKTASTYSQLEPVDPSTTSGGKFNPYNSMILMASDLDEVIPKDGETYSTLQRSSPGPDLHGSDQQTYSILRNLPEQTKNMNNIQGVQEETYSALRQTTQVDISEHYEVSPQMKRKQQPPPSPVPIRSNKLPVKEKQRSAEEVASETTFEPAYSMETFYSDLQYKPSPPPVKAKPVKPDKLPKKPTVAAPATHVGTSSTPVAAAGSPVVTDPNAPPVPPRRKGMRTENTPPTAPPRQPKS